MQDNIINNMKRYAEYLRKSRKDIEAESHGEGETLKKHELILSNLYNSMGISKTQVDVFREGVVSGDSISSRPVIQELLQLVEQGVYAGVFVVEIERLARGNTLDQGIVANAFQYSNTKIITPLKIYDPSNEYDQEYFEFGLFMSRREYKTINRRLQKGREISATQGKFPGSRPPYGYKRKKIENDKGWTLEIIPEQAEIVKMIFDMYTYKNMSPTEISKYLDSLNIKPLKSETWSVYSIRDILSNPVYIGKIRWKNRKIVKVVKNGSIKNTQPKNKGNDVILSKGIHQPIIDEQTFYIAQNKRRDSNTSPIPSIYNIKNPFAGLIRCAKCNRIMIRIQPNTIACTNPKCNNISTRMDILEDKILESLKTWLKNYEKEINETSIEQENINDIIHIKQTSMKKLQSELIECDKQIEKIYDFLEKGIYSIDVFTDRKTKILQKQQELLKKYSEIEKELDNIEQTKKAKISLIPKTKDVLTAYKNCNDPKMKNYLLKSVVEKIEYLKTEKCYNQYGKLDNFELLIYPKF